MGRQRPLRLDRASRVGAGHLIVDLRGSAESVDMTNLPASMHAPKLRTNLSIANYHLKGEGPRVVASATLKESVIEGATFEAGTVGEIDNTQRLLTYSAKGTVSNLNLVEIGDALDIEVLSHPQYDSEVNGEFDVRGSGTTLPTLTLDASGTVTDTSIMGARLPHMTFRDAHRRQRARRQGRRTVRASQSRKRDRQGAVARTADRFG